MNDFKNVLLAWASASTSVVAAVEAQTLISIISAVVLPILLFAAGKTVDVLLQIHLHGRDGDDDEGDIR